MRPWRTLTAVLVTLIIMIDINNRLPRKKQTNLMYFQQSYVILENIHPAWALTIFLKVSQGHKPKNILIKVPGKCKSKAIEKKKCACDIFSLRPLTFNTIKYRTELNDKNSVHFKTAISPGDISLQKPCFKIRGKLGV